MNVIIDDKIDEACKNFKKIKYLNIDKFKTLDEWLYNESKLFEREINCITKNITFKKFKRGQVIKVNFGINIGGELSHTHFAIVLNKFDNINSSTLTVVPITSKYCINRVYLGKILKDIFPNSEKYILNCYANITQIKQ